MEHKREGRGLLASYPSLRELFPYSTHRQETKIHTQKSREEEKATKVRLKHSKERSKEEKEMTPVPRSGADGFALNHHPKSPILFSSPISKAILSNPNTSGVLQGGEGMNKLSTQAHASGACTLHKTSTSYVSRTQSQQCENSISCSHSSSGGGGPYASAKVIPSESGTSAAAELEGSKHFRRDSKSQGTSEAGDKYFNDVEQSFRRNRTVAVKNILRRRAKHFVIASGLYVLYSFIYTRESVACSQQVCWSLEYSDGCNCDPWSQTRLMSTLRRLSSEIFPLIIPMKLMAMSASPVSSSLCNSSSTSASKCSYSIASLCNSSATTDTLVAWFVAGSLYFVALMNGYEDTDARVGCYLTMLIYLLIFRICPRPLPSLSSPTLAASQGQVYPALSPRSLELKRKERSKHYRTTSPSVCFSRSSRSATTTSVAFSDELLDAFRSSQKLYHQKYGQSAVYWLYYQYHWIWTRIARFMPTLCFLVYSAGMEYVIWYNMLALYTSVFPNDGSPSSSSRSAPAPAPALEEESPSFSPLPTTGVGLLGSLKNKYDKTYVLYALPLFLMLLGNVWTFITTRWFFSEHMSMDEYHMISVILISSYARVSRFVPIFSYQGNHLPWSILKSLALNAVMDGWTRYDLMGWILKKFLRRLDRQFPSQMKGMSAAFSISQFLPPLPHPLIYEESLHCQPPSPSANTSEQGSNTSAAAVAAKCKPEEGNKEKQEHVKQQEAERNEENPKFPRKILSSTTSSVSDTSQGGHGCVASCCDSCDTARASLVSSSFTSKYSALAGPASSHSHYARLPIHSTSSTSPGTAAAFSIKLTQTSPSLQSGEETKKCQEMRAGARVGQPQKQATSFASLYRRSRLSRMLAFATPITRYSPWVGLLIVNYYGRSPSANASTPCSGIPLSKEINLLTFTYPPGSEFSLSTLFSSRKWWFYPVGIVLETALDSLFTIMDLQKRKSKAQLRRIREQRQDIERMEAREAAVGAAGERETFCSNYTAAGREGKQEKVGLRPVAEKKDSEEEKRIEESAAAAATDGGELEESCKGKESKELDSHREKQDEEEKVDAKPRELQREDETLKEGRKLSALQQHLQSKEKGRKEAMVEEAEEDDVDVEGLFYEPRCLLWGVVVYFASIMRAMQYVEGIPYALLLCDVDGDYQDICPNPL